MRTLNEFLVLLIGVQFMHPDIHNLGLLLMVQINGPRGCPSVTSH